MICKLFRSIIFSILLLASPSVFADDLCPPSIEVTQGIKTAPGGWAISDSKLPIDWTGIAMFNGPPEELASLVPDGKDEKDNKEARRHGAGQIITLAAADDTLGRVNPTKQETALSVER